MAFIEGKPQPQGFLGQLGESLHKGMSQIAQFKMQQMMQRQQQAQTAKAYAPVIGEKWANVLSQVPEKEHANWLRALPALKQLETAQTQGSQTQQQAIPGMQSEMSALQQVLKPGQAQASPMQASQMQQPSEPQLSQEEIIARAFEPPQMKLEREKMAQKERLEQQKMAVADRREAHKEKLDVDKYYRPTITKMNEEYKGIRESAHKLDRMEQLVKGGKLSGPKVAASLQALSEGFSAFVPGFGPIHLPGLNFKSALKPDSEEFEKLSMDFIKNAKTIFGSRITDQDLKSFMATVPNMMMTDEGKLRLIKHMRFYNDAIRSRYDAMRGVLKKHDDYAPRNFELKIEDAASKKLDQLANEFKFSLKPKAELKAAPEEPGILGQAAGAVNKLWDKLPGIF